MAPNWDLAFAVVPRVAAFFSLLGSGFIVYEVISDVKKRKKVYHRIMCGMSCFDIIGSICYFLGRWPMPADGLSGFGLSGGVGTDATCKTQAFFGQAVVGTVTYNAVLAVQYFMIVNLSMSETTIAKKYEKIMHAIPFFMWIVTAIIGISFDALNPAFFNCWITPAPINCAAAGEIPDGRPPCERGYYAPVLQWAIFYGPIWALIIIVTFIMASVYASVRKLEKANSKYTGSQTSSKADSAKRSRMVAKQGLWYLFPFYATWVFPVATEITEMATAQYFNPMVILVAFFLPFQGALNFIIYMRPRFIKYRKKHQSWNICYIIYRTVRKSLCCIAKDEDDMFASGIGANTSVVSRTSVLNRESAVAEYNRRNTIDAQDQTIEQPTRKSSVTFADGENVDTEEEKVEEDLQEKRGDRRRKMSWKKQSQHAAFFGAGSHVHQQSFDGAIKYYSIDPNINIMRSAKSQGFSIISLLFVVVAFCCMWAGSIRCNFLRFDGTDINGAAFPMELGLWYYAFYAWVVVPGGSGLTASFYQYGTCNAYEEYTQIDPTWKAAQAFSIITFILGIFTLVAVCVTSCVTNCYQKENGFATTYGWQAPLCLFTALCQGLVLLFLASNACNSRVLMGLGGRDTWNATFPDTCSLSTGANLVISAVVFWFSAAVTSGMAHKFEQQDDMSGDEVAPVDDTADAAKKAEEGEGNAPEPEEQPVVVTN